MKLLPKDYKLSIVNNLHLPLYSFLINLSYLPTRNICHPKFCVYHSISLYNFINFICTLKPYY